MDGIASYNSLALDALGVKQVKRSTVKYKGGSSFPCKLCDFAAKNLSTLKKHDVSYHGINLYASNSLSSLAPLKHSTRNNSISEALLQENMTITSLSNQSAKITLDDNILKFTCLDCNFVSKKKEEMTNHAISLHNEIGLNFICGLCDHKFHGAEDYNIHVRVHDKESMDVNKSSGITETEVKCNKCDHEFLNNGELKSHILSAHSEEPRVVEVEKV